MNKLLTVFIVFCMVLSMTCIYTFAEDGEKPIWKEETPIPTVRHDSQSCVVGNKIYVMGGISDTSILNSLDIYDTKTKLWTKGNNMPETVKGFGAVAVGSKIYVMGGLKENIASKNVWIYDTKTDSWTEGKPMLKGKFYFGISSVKNNIYIVCGAENSEKFSNTVEVYDTKTNTWGTGAPAKYKKCAFGLAKEGNKLYSMGGLIEGNKVSSDFEIYDTEANTWTEILASSSRIHKTHLSAVAVEGKLYTIGGSGGARNLEDGYPDEGTPTTYDIDIKQWGISTNIGPYRDRLSAAVVNGTIYIIGGREKGNSIKDVNKVNSLKVAEPRVNNLLLSVLLNIDENVQLSTSFNLENNKKYTWSSTNEVVATVDNNGKVTAIAEGEADIYAQNADGSFKEYVHVKVVDGRADELRLAVHLKRGGNTRLYLTDDTNQVTWSSIDESVATIDNNGKVTGIKRGLSIIEAEFDGQTYQIYVRVNG